MKTVYSFLVLGLFAFGQTDPPPAAPAPAQTRESAEAALRKNADQFYAALVQHKPRIAQNFVCESGQDFFYNNPKPNFFSAAVNKLKFAADLKTAKVQATIQLDMPMMFEKGPAKMPIESDWKWEQEQWCYVPDPNAARANSFPGMPPGMSAGKSAAPVAAEGMANAAKASLVSFSKQELSYPKRGGTDQVVIHNGLQEPVGLALTCPSLQGVVCKLDKQSLAANQDAVLSVEVHPPAKGFDPQPSVSVSIAPYGRVVPLALKLRR